MVYLKIPTQSIAITDSDFGNIFILQRNAKTGLLGFYKNCNFYNGNSLMPCFSAWKVD